MHRGCCFQNASNIPYQSAMATISSSDEKRRALFTYIWKIESAPINKCVMSPVFTVQSLEMTKFSLGMVILRPLNKVEFWLERKKEDNEPENIAIKLELSILDTNGSSLIKRSCTGLSRNSEEMGYFEFFESDALFDKRKDELFPKDPIIVRYRFWRKGTEISKSELCFASTQFDVYRPSSVWVVKGFNSLQQGEKRIRILQSAEKGRPQLTLTLSLAEMNGKNRVFIHLAPSHIINEFRMEAEIALLDAEGMVFFRKRVLKPLNVYEKDILLTIFEKSQIPAVLLSEDVLLLRCEMKLTSPDPIWSRIEGYKFMDYSDSKLVQTDKKGTFLDKLNATCPFKEIVNTFKEDGTLSDVCLRAGTKLFPVHKLILSSRSPVFKAMFTQDMREKTSKCIDIPDLNADTLGWLLLYIYENKIQEFTWETAGNLFEAADKYELLDLKEKCSRFLKLNLSGSNVCKILVLADMHHDESLRKSAQEFILNNPEIMHSDVWKIFREDHSKLALEAAEQIIYNMKHSRS
ncbi:unnamed protein product [Larinioides sclopetarius]|uniref:BTB domain-containing protein n=1 Tax=Larinioides sclopetarius TaxID=280406 RepID=A0AAV2BPU9_9ARAC